MGKEQYKNRENYEKCLSFFDENLERICKVIDDKILEESDNLTKFLSFVTNLIVDKETPHYEWYNDNDPYDYSGDLKKNGFINLRQSLEDFLNEYTGNWEATYISYHWKHWKNYDDELSNYSFEITSYIIEMVVKEYCIKLNCEKLASEIAEDMFDDFYSNSLAYDFFHFSSTCDVLSVDMKQSTKNFLKLGKPYYEKYLNIKEKINHKDTLIKIFYEKLLN